MDMLSAQAIQDAGLADWRKLMLGLHARFLTGSFAEGVRFVSAVGDAASAVPEIKLGDGFVDLRLGAADERDLDLARTISSIAQSLGLKADPSAVAHLELGLDTADRDAIGPFWAAVLTGDPAAYEDIEVVDSTGRVVTIWFQKTEPHEPPRQRFHLDLWLAPEAVPGRIEAALAAGGTVASDDEAPAFTVLADPQGNKVCLCTYLDR
jgi:4a-hydroxytetrahydrobiopterin dehydratase